MNRRRRARDEEELALLSKQSPFTSLAARPGATVHHLCCCESASRVRCVVFKIFAAFYYRTNQISLVCFSFEKLS